MRFRWLSSMALLLASAAVLAQPPGQAPQPTGGSGPTLDQILVGWERAMAGIGSLWVQVERRTVDKTFATEEVFSGVAKYVKPNKMLLHLVNTKKPTDFEKIVCNGQTAYQWDPPKKEIGVVTLPANKDGQVGEENFVSLLFGMKAAEAKRRYDLELMPQPNPKDPIIYYYIKVVPTQRADQAEFTRARLVLNVQTLLPREIFFESPNGNTIKWDFQKTALNPQLDPREFGPPAPEAGWQLKKIAPQQGPPGAIRAQQL
jgi:TIGR03009 family protein